MSEEKSTCICARILATQPLRHFKECPERKPLPEEVEVLVASSAVKSLDLHDLVIRMRRRERELKVMYGDAMTQLRFEESRRTKFEALANDIAFRESCHAIEIPEVEGTGVARLIRTLQTIDTDIASQLGSVTIEDYEAVTIDDVSDLAADCILRIYAWEQRAEFLLEEQPFVESITVAICRDDKVLCLKCAGEDNHTESDIEIAGGPDNMLCHSCKGSLWIE